MTVLVHPLIAAIPCLIIHWLISPGIRSYLLVLKIPRKAQIITVSKMSRADWRMDTNVINCFYWFHVVIEFRTFFRVYASCFVMRIRKTVKSTCRREKWEPNKGNKQAKKKRQQNNERRRNRKKPHVRLYKYKCVMSGLKVTSPGQMSCRYLIRMDILEKKDSPLFPFSPNFVLFAPISLTPPQRGLCLVAYTGSSQGIIYTWTGGGG